MAGPVPEEGCFNSNAVKKEEKKKKKKPAKRWLSQQRMSQQAGTFSQPLLRLKKIFAHLSFHTSDLVK